MDKISSYRALIWTEDPDKLAEFYRNVLELEEVLKYELPDDYGYAFKVGDSMPLWIGKHGGVVGKNTEPFRHMINLYVEDVVPWYEKLRSIVTIIQEPMVTPPTRELPEEQRLHVFTFLDPDGNCLQMMEKA
jgi:catechol 2,3-dioxygenase-like lactoylglutathione lyase family enzyme